MLTGNLTITDSKLFSDETGRAFADLVDKNANKISTSVKGRVINIVRASLYDSTTIKSLLNGTLRDDFGLTSSMSTAAVAQILTYISTSIEVEIKKSGKYSKVILHIIGEKDITNIVNLSSGSFESKGGSVPWLYWLLTRGTEVVVGDFWLFAEATGRTRSGGTKIMKKIESTVRDPFRVDPSHAGTIDDNFITRAIQSVFKDILDAVAESTIGALS